MKKKSTVVIVIIILIVLVSIIIMLFDKRLKSKTIKIDSKPVNDSSVATPTLSLTPTSTSKYSPSLRAGARNSFIANCKLKVGQQYTEACECGADYLAAHYTDEQLEKVYIEYHSSNNIPSEIQTAYDACRNK
jgi:hypothetical protein